MNETPTLEKENFGTESFTSIVSNKQKNKNPYFNIVKKWVKKMPYFLAMDYFRRKVYDSFAF